MTSKRTARLHKQAKDTRFEKEDAAEIRRRFAVLSLKRLRLRVVPLELRPIAIPK